MKDSSQHGHVVQKQSTAHWLEELLSIISAEQTFASASYVNILITTNKAFPQLQLLHFKSQHLKEKLAVQDESTVPSTCTQRAPCKLNFCILSQFSVVNQATLFYFVQFTGIGKTKQTFQMTNLQAVFELS